MPAAALEIGSRDLVELKVAQDQVVNWQGDGFSLGCQKGSTCLFDASKFSKGSYHISYFREESQTLHFGSELIEISSENVRQKKTLSLPLKQKITPEDVFAAPISGVGFIERDGKKIILKNFPEVLYPNDLVKNIGGSVIYLNLSKTESALLQKDSLVKMGGPDPSAHPHVWLKGDGIFTATNKTLLKVGTATIQSGNKGGRILIYDSQDGLGILPMEGEFEIKSKNTSLKFSAPFGFEVNDQKTQLTSRLSCDDPLEYVKARIPFTAECKDLRIKNLGVLLLPFSEGKGTVSNKVSQELKLPWHQTFSLKSGLEDEQKLIMGVGDNVAKTASFPTKMRYFLSRNDCMAVNNEPSENDKESELKTYYSSICSVRSSKYSGAKNKLLWVKPRLTDDSLSQSVDTLLQSDWVRALPKENLSLFFGRDSNGFLKEAQPTSSPFKGYSERFMPFFGASLNRQWCLFEEAPLALNLQLSIEAKAYLVENQIPFARHFEDITLPLAFHLSKDSFLELSPITRMLGNGFPLETIGAGMYAKIKIESMSVKTDVLNTDDFNDQPEIIDYVSGNPTYFTSTKTSDRPFTTRSTTVAYEIATARTSNQVYFEYLRSRYLQFVENNQSYRAIAIGGDSQFTLMKQIQFDLGFKFEKRSYMEGQKGSLLKLSGKSLWNFSPDYSTFLKLDHTASKGSQVNATWKSTQASMGLTKELR